jgi:hypothetical protein
VVVPFISRNFPVFKLASASYMPTPRFPFTPYESLIFKISSQLTLKKFSSLIVHAPATDQKLALGFAWPNAE